MFTDIAKGDINVAVQENDCSCDWPGSYGWQLGNTTMVGMRKDGPLTKDVTLKNRTKTGDTIELVLDCDKGTTSG